MTQTSRDRRRRAGTATGWRTALTATTACLLGVGACSNGGNGQTASLPYVVASPQTTEKRPEGRGTVLVTVKDRLGAPVAGATVDVLTYWGDEDKRAITGADGKAEFRNVIASAISIIAHGRDSYVEMSELSVTADSVLSLDAIVQRSGGATGGILWSAPAADTVSPDGTNLEFTLRFIRIPDPGEYPYSSWSNDAVRIVACSPDSTNDTPAFRADCVAGADGYDAEYAGAVDGTAVAIESVPVLGAGRSEESMTALLIEQSASVITADPADERLFAAKVFLSDASEQQVVALAAFAGDDLSQGQPGLLPMIPVTLYPTEQPRFTADGQSFFTSVDGLAAQEGGNAPLYAAMQGTLNLFPAAGESSAEAAIVIIATGHDDNCGSGSECRQKRVALLEASRARGARIYAIGLADPSGDWNHESLGSLARGSDGGLFLASNPRQLTSILDTVRAVQRGRQPAFDATFRIRSPVPGAFAPGHTVLGRVRLEVCPWDCLYTDVPFVVQIE